MIAQQIGSYCIVRLLGMGGMGAVYEARDHKINRRAAIKILHAELARDPQIVTRFLNEARAANLAQHPGIVDIYEHGQMPDGTAYIVMQFLDGESLRERLRRLSTLGNAALRLGRQMASALVVAHEQGIVHRDLKPENIMVVRDPEAPGGERTKVLDFGIAKLATGLRAPGEQHTLTGTIMGTPAYMAPEQCRGQNEVNDRADVYALGIMLYEMVVGTTPFRGDTGELIAAHLYSRPPPVSGATELNALLQRMLQKTPRSRPSMRQALAELERLSAAQAAEPSCAGPLALSADNMTSPGSLPWATTLNSTLGRATGQAVRDRSMWRSPLGAVAALAGFLAIGAGGLALRPRGSAEALPIVKALPEAPRPPPPVTPDPPAPPARKLAIAEALIAAKEAPLASSYVKKSEAKRKNRDSTQVADKHATQPTEEDDNYVPEPLH